MPRWLIILLGAFLILGILWLIGMRVTIHVYSL